MSYAPAWRPAPLLLVTMMVFGAEPVARVEADGLVAGKQASIVVRLRDARAGVEAAIDMPSMPGMAVARYAFAAPAGAVVRIEHMFPHGGAFRLRLTVNGQVEDFSLTVKGGAENDLMMAAMGPATGGGWYASGTSQVPRETPQLMTNWDGGGWNVMLHGVGMLTHLNQTGPRGRDKIFAANWLMGMASHRVGPGVLTLRSMLTLEPLTVTGKRYPLLFQTGETANGVPIVNGQHPHDFVMELAASYQVKLGRRTSVSLYGGPRGDPALGPPAFPHRMSASENPLAVISHHHQDSTHISGNVITGGVTHGPVTWEVSGFHGREPDEKRWGMESGGIDSVSTRLTVSPTARWTGQFSVGRINNRETTHPIRDTLRTTASLGYSRKLARGHWASILVWGRNHDLAFTQLPSLNPVLPTDSEFKHIVAVPTRIPGQKYNSFLAESTVRFRSRNWVWGRVENTDKDTLLLFEEAPFLLLVEEQRYARVQLATAGYSRELRSGVSWLSPALGGQVTWFHAPPRLAPVFGVNSFGAQLIFRVRLGAWFRDE
ncbi:MAG: hypothetical protein U0R19_31985 [Bryobacteraceae bacterium]